MRVALWTPTPDAAWVEALAAELGRGMELVLVGAEPAEPPQVDVDLYHVAGSPAHGVVYRALLRRPGIVCLGEWGLHALVHAETVGRGDPDAYRREARRAHGDKGAFVARQVLAGLGGALPALLAMNQRVLDASLALVAFTEELRARAAALLPARPVVYLPLDRLALGAETAPGTDAVRLAAALRALILELAPRAEAERQARAARAAGEDTPLGFALDELRWTARELGLAELPEDTEPLVATLLANRERP
jgi:hypothetical protein